MRKLSILVVLVLVVVFLSGCLPDTERFPGDRPAGLLMGIWHGWVAPLSLIVGIFRPGVRVYETFNTGWWYDFGFYIAVISGFGGLSLSRKKFKNTSPRRPAGWERPVN